MIDKERCMNLVKTLRDECNLTWNDVAYQVNTKTGNNLSSSAYRMAYYDWSSKNVDKVDTKGCIDVDPIPHVEETEDNKDDYIQQVYEMQKEKMQMADYRSEVNRMYRRMAREDSIKEIANEAAYIVSKAKPFIPNIQPGCVTDTHDENAAILCLSDWHYGSCQDSIYNKYDPEICVQRIYKLIKEVINRLTRQGFNKYDRLYIVNLGDLVNGIIHTQIRINNRIDVIQQIMDVSEIMANVIFQFSNYYKVHYVSTMDNHSRIMPDKKDSLDYESLCRITDWYVKRRCEHLDVVFHDNTYGDDIATFNVLGHNVAAAHGDKDTPNNIIKNLTLHTRQPYDLMLSAHRHHFSADEENECVLICNGSVMGTDDYAKSLRLNSKASQTLIISTQENAADTIYKINLN